MSFTMTHLIIADRINSIFVKEITNAPQFYVGSIAPDAVHNRLDYISDYKKASHLCVGEERWGMITNNDEWNNSIIHFFNKHKKTENQDFVLGYCSHILADMYNNITVWTPYRLKHPDELEKGYGNLHHQESNKMDIELALTHERKDFYMSNLRKSISVDFDGIIYAIEIEKQKDLIFNTWYKDKQRQDIKSNKLVTYESTMDFVRDATDFIVDNLQKHL